MGVALSTVVVMAASTVTVTEFDLPGRKSASPAKLAVNVYVPGVSSAVWYVATPLLSGAVPRRTVPLKKVTAPVGVPEVVLCTAAVNVIGLPAGIELALAVRATVTGAWFMVNVTVAAAVA